jgi:hypothetical protein
MEETVSFPKSFEATEIAEAFPSFQKAWASKPEKKVCWQRQTAHNRSPNTCQEGHAALGFRTWLPRFQALTFLMNNSQ